MYKLVKPRFFILFLSFYEIYSILLEEFLNLFTFLVSQEDFSIQFNSRLILLQT